jgi:hypothetical protein
MSSCDSQRWWNKSVLLLLLLLLLIVMMMMMMMFVKGKGFSATSLMWLLGFQEVKAPGSSQHSALRRW